MKLSKVIFLFLCLTLTTAVIPSANAQSTSVSLSDVKVLGPDSNGKIIVQGDVTVNGICPSGIDGSGVGILLINGRTDGMWPQLPEYYDIERKCDIIEGHCVDRESSVFYGFPTDFWDCSWTWGLGGGLNQDDEGRTFHFSEEWNFEPMLSNGPGVNRLSHNYLKLVACLTLSCNYFISGTSRSLEISDDCPFPRPYVKQFFWDESSVFDLKALKSDDLSVTLTYYPEKPKSDETIDFAAAVFNPGGFPLTYEWYIDGIKVSGDESKLHYGKMTEGTHTAKVVVTDTKGGTAEDNVAFTVRENSPPTVETLTFDLKDPTADDTITFTATAKDPDGDSLTYEWYINGQHVAETSGTLKEKMPEGTHTVKVVVSDGWGEEAEKRILVNIRPGKIEKNHPPTVKLICTPPNPKPGQYFKIEAIAEDKDSDDILKYEFYNLREDKVDDTANPGRNFMICQGPKGSTSAGWWRVRVYDGHKDGIAEDSIFVVVYARETLSEVLAEVVEGKITVNGMELSKGDKWEVSEFDRVETSPTGYAVIKYQDGSQMKIDAGVLMNVKQKGQAVNIKKGNVWGRFNVKDEKEPLEVTTPSATGKVEGTVFEVMVEEDGTTTFRVFEGIVEVSDIKMMKTVSVYAGETSVCKVGGIPSDPKPFDPSFIVKWLLSPPWDSLTAEWTIAVDVIGLTFESRSKPSGSSVQIPLTLNGIEDKIGNMDITLSYDSSVLEATEVTKGDLTSDSLFEYNITAGTILISLADADGFSGNGSIAYVTFNVIGAADSSSPLQIAALAANRAEDYEVLTIPTNDGVFSVESGLTVSVSDTTGAKGSTIEVPIILEGASEVGSMDIVLNYDATVLSAVAVEACELGKNALIAANTANDGEVIIALADSTGINGDGAVASVAFEVIGDAGTTSVLTLEEVMVHNLDLGEIIPNTESGTFLVI